MVSQMNDDPIIKNYIDSNSPELVDSLNDFVSELKNPKITSKENPVDKCNSINEIVSRFQEFDLDQLRSFFNKKFKTDLRPYFWDEFVDEQVLLSRIIALIEEGSMKSIEPLTLNFRLSKLSTSRLKFIEQNPLKKSINIGNKDMFVDQLISSSNKSLFPKTIIENAIEQIYNEARNEKDILHLISIIYNRRFCWTESMVPEEYADDMYKLECEKEWKKIILKIATARLNTTEAFIINSRMYDVCFNTAEKWWKRDEENRNKLQPNLDNLDEDERNRAEQFAEKYLNA